MIPKEQELEEMVGRVVWMWHKRSETGAEVDGRASGVQWAGENASGKRCACPPRQSAGNWGLWDGAGHSMSLERDPPGTRSVDRPGGGSRGGEEQSKKAGF